METIEGNKLIAEFMGLIVWSGGEKHPDLLFTDHNTDDLDCLEVVGYISCWDWLMPVVEKIRNDHYFEIEFYGDYTRANVVYETGVNGFQLSKWTTECNSIKVVWLVIVQFIKWYNNAK